MNSAAWVFECEGCGKRWTDPDAPVTGHYCNWNGRGMPPEDMDESEVRVVESPGGEAA